MGFRLLNHGIRSDDPPADGLRYATQASRQLWAMVREWGLASGADAPPPSALGQGLPVTGIYQAIGLEKRQVFAGAMAVVDGPEGFDGFKPAAMIFEHMPIGPFAQLAVATQSTGPFYSLEGEAVAGGITLLTALEDLAAGNCERALVGAYRRTAPRAWLMAIAPDQGRPTRWHGRFTHGRNAPNEADLAQMAEQLGVTPEVVRPDPVADPLGLAAHAAMLEAAENGVVQAVWSHTADGRGLLVGVRHP